jgi:drug/metabolite transporter (DMT)-like permease
MFQISLDTETGNKMGNALLPIIFVIFWAAGFTFAKMGLQSASPFTLLCLRYACAVILFLPIFLLLRPALPTTRRAWLNVGITGLMMQVVFFTFVYHAIVFGVTAGTIAVIASLQPILVGIFAPRFTGDQVSRLQWFGLILGLIGAVVVVSQTSVVGFEAVGGILLGIFALLTMTFVTLFEKRSGTNVHPVSANLIQFAVGLIVTAPFALIFEGFAFEPTRELAVSVAYLVICNSFISVTILLYLVRVGEVHKVSALFFLVPPSAAIISYLLIGETLTTLAFAGVALAAIGVFLVRR